MSVEFIGIDPSTDRDHCRTVWVDVEAQEILFQGWKRGDEPGEIPARMVPLIREACDAVERVELR
ncbi:hypothetical protein ACWGCP_07845 [Streptomyces niveus]